jgi:hypothetical protein
MEVIVQVDTVHIRHYLDWVSHEMCSIRKSTYFWILLAMIIKNAEKKEQQEKHFNKIAFFNRLSETLKLYINTWYTNFVKSSE